MFLWRKLENERDDATSAGLVDYLPEYWGAQVRLSSAEYVFFSSVQRFPDAPGPRTSSAAPVDRSLLNRFSHGSGRILCSTWCFTRPARAGERLLPKVHTK